MPREGTLKGANGRIDGSEGFRCRNAPPRRPKEELHRKGINPMLVEERQGQSLNSLNEVNKCSIIEGQVQMSI